MRKFDLKLAKILVDSILDGEEEIPTTVEELKVVSDELVSSYDFPLLGIGDCLSALPMTLPCGLVDAAIATVWETVEWDKVLDYITSRLENEWAAEYNNED